MLSATVTLGSVSVGIFALFVISIILICVLLYDRIVKLENKMEELVNFTEQSIQNLSKVATEAIIVLEKNITELTGITRNSFTILDTSVKDLTTLSISTIENMNSSIVSGNSILNTIAANTTP